MRFAPPNPLRIADRASGMNAWSVRSFNERLVLSLLLQNKDTSRVEIGEKTGLSAQTISVIVRSLEQEGLVAKGEAQRGRVGPPTIPLSLNPEGAYSIGVSIGSRFIDVVLIDFIGAVRFHAALLIPVENNKALADTIQQAVEDALLSLRPDMQGRVAGLGLAIPEALETYDVLADRAAVDILYLRTSLEKSFELPVFVQNDITAAAGAESMFGVAKPLKDHLFFFLGGRLHSRLILNHQIYHGNSTLSFDVGLIALEKALALQGREVEPLWHRSGIWPQPNSVMDAWFATCVEKLCDSIHALSQFVEVRTVVLSSYAPLDVCARLSAAISERIPAVEALVGNIDFSPKAVGAASLPFASRFMVES